MGTLPALNMKTTVASLLLLGLVAGQDSSVKGRLKAQMRQWATVQAHCAEARNTDGSINPETAMECRKCQAGVGDWNTEDGFQRGKVCLEKYEPKTVEVCGELFQQYEDSGYDAMCFNCDITAANSRCYATLAKFKSDPLDSCEKNLVNTKSSQTVGDFLCGQVKRWLRNDAVFKANGRDNIRIPIYYSSCGGNWTQVSPGGEGLYVDEPLCCTSVGSFRRCDGSSFKDTC